MMSYDFLEVIFISASKKARTNWDLGMPAGIYGVVRDDGTVYGGDFEKACLFAGKKSDKTLFGIGVIATVTPTPVTAGTIEVRTDSVTFEISAILSGLLLYADTAPAGGRPNTRGVAFDSFGKASQDVILGSETYPLYNLDFVTIAAAAAARTKNYTFGAVQSKVYWAAAKLIGSDDPPVVQRRTPRFMDGGAYREPKTMVNTKTKVELASSYPTDKDDSFNPVIPLLFSTTSDTATGYFSAYIEVPVYMVDDFAPPAYVAPPGTADPDYGKWTTRIKWFIRSGYGSELYSIDDGTSSGGCILFGRGTTGSGDWLEIEWRWLPYPTS